MIRDSLGWAGTVGEVLPLDPGIWLRSLAAHHTAVMAERPSASQLEVWREEGGIMRHSLRDVSSLVRCVTGGTI